MYTEIGYLYDKSCISFKKINSSERTEPLAVKEQRREGFGKKVVFNVVREKRATAFFRSFQ